MPLLNNDNNIIFGIFLHNERHNGRSFEIITISSQAENIFLDKQEDIRRDKMPNQRLSDCRLGSACMAQIVDVTRNANTAATHNVKTPKRPRQR